MIVTTRLLAAALLSAALVACGTAEGPPPAPTAPSETAAVTLPWPVGDPAGIRLLQERVDGGAQPWLLDPGSVATSFGTAAYGWQDAPATVVAADPDGTAVEIGGPDGRVVRLLLAQPGRTGRGGIWVVTTAGGS